MHVARMSKHKAVAKQVCLRGQTRDGEAGAQIT